MGNGLILPSEFMLSSGSDYDGDTLQMWAFGDSEYSIANDALAVLFEVYADPANLKETFSILNMDYIQNYPSKSKFNFPNTVINWLRSVDAAQVGKGSTAIDAIMGKASAYASLTKAHIEEVVKNLTEEKGILLSLGLDNNSALKALMVFNRDILDKQIDFPNFFSIKNDNKWDWNLPLLATSTNRLKFVDSENRPVVGIRVDKPYKDLFTFIILWAISLFILGRSRNCTNIAYSFVVSELVSSSVKLALSKYSIATALDISVNVSTLTSTPLCPANLLKSPRLISN